MVHNNKTQAETVKLVMCQPPYCVLMENGFMVHTQMETVMTISHVNPLQFCWKMVPWFIIK